MNNKNCKPALFRGLGLFAAALLCTSSMALQPALVQAEDFSEMTDDELPFDSAANGFGEWEDGSGTVSNPVPSTTTTPSQGPVQPQSPAENEPDSQTLEPAVPQENGMQAANAPEQDLLIGYESADLPYGDKENPRPSAVTLDGIDISNWQKSIDIDKVPADFIICKATGGKGFKDKSFDGFARKILDGGRLFGFYHYANDFGYEGTPEEEAAFFYEQTKDYIGLGIPVLDYEDPDLLRSGTDWAYRFLEEYQRLSGVKCMVYTSSHFTRSLDWTTTADAGYPLWVANYGKNEEREGYINTEDAKTDGLGTGKFETYYMHQYTSRGKLDGYEGRLDLNKFYGSAADWQNLTLPASIRRPMYRVYNLYTGEHFYTQSKSEYRGLVQAGWKDEEIAWISPKEGKNVYRMLNPSNGDHHYTTEVAERDNLIGNGWIFEGVGWRSEDPEKGIPVYRVYNPNAQSGAHHFTLDHNEIETLVSYGWDDEGIAWYALDPAAAMEEMRSETAAAQASRKQEVYRNLSKY